MFGGAVLVLMSGEITRSELVELYADEPEPVQVVLGLEQQSWIDAEDFEQLMTAGNGPHLDRLLLWDSLSAHKFRGVECPGCRAVGLARWRFLGRLRHDRCGARWTASPFAWMGQQAKAWSKAGGGGKGCLGAVVDLAMLVGFWLLTVALLLPFQCLAYSIRERERHPIGGVFALLVPLAYVVAAVWIAVTATTR